MTFPVLSVDKEFIAAYWVERYHELKQKLVTEADTAPVQGIMKYLNNTVFVGVKEQSASAIGTTDMAIDEAAETFDNLILGNPDDSDLEAELVLMHNSSPVAMTLLSSVNAPQQSVDAEPVSELT